MEFDFCSWGFELVFTLNKNPEYLNFCNPALSMPLVAEVIKSSLLFCPPNAQLVIFCAGRLIRCINLAFLLKTETRAPLKCATHKFLYLSKVIPSGDPSLGDNFLNIFLLIILLFL